MSTNGLQVVAGSGGFQDFSQPSDMHIYRSFFQVNIGSPYVVKQLRATVAASRMAHKKLQQAVFSGPCMNLKPFMHDAVGIRVQYQFSDDQHAIFVDRAASA